MWLGGRTVAESCPPLPCEHSAIASCTPFDESVSCPALSATAIFLPALLEGRMQPRCRVEEECNPDARESCGLRAAGVLEEAAEGAAVETRTLLQPARTADTAVVSGCERLWAALFERQSGHQPGLGQSRDRGRETILSRF